MKSHKTKYLILLLVIAALVILFIFSRYYTSTPVEIKKEVILYFSDDRAMYLNPERRTITTTSEKTTLYKDTLQELIKGPKTQELKKTIPEGVKVLNLNIKDDILIINFNKALKENHWGGSTGELMTVYSIVSTLTEFKNIEKVKFLIDGKEIESLAGHLDLSEPLDKDKNIIKNKEH